MDDSGWTSFEDAKPPDGSQVLCFIEGTRHGSKFVVWSSRKIANGYLVTIGDLFHFDSSSKLLCWKPLSDIEASLPLQFTDKEANDGA